MNPLQGLVIINPTLKGKKARILNHGFGQRELFILLTWAVNLWRKGQRGPPRPWMHMNSSCSFWWVPDNFFRFPGIVLQLLCVTSVSEPSAWSVLFATQFLDPNPGDRRELTPLEKLSAVCGVRVGTAISLCWARTSGVWISIPQLWGETLQGP